MRLVHLSDLHIGFRQYDQTNAYGINRRELDVSSSLTAAITKTIEIAPALVVIGGDVFHKPKPGPNALVHAAREFRRLRRELPNVEIVMVAGNHDWSHMTADGSILRIFTLFGVHVIDSAPRTIDLPHLDCAVLGVADTGHERPELVPTAGRKYNVLLLHGEAGGISPKGSPAAEKEIADEDFHAREWSYIALGHYHVHREVLPNAFYSGAIDYTSSNNWGEFVEEAERGLQGKGIVERDLETGRHTFHALPRTRQFIDVEPFSARELSTEDLNARMAAILAAHDVDGAVVRIRITDIEKETAHAIDRKVMREFKKRALHFQFQTQRDTLIRDAVTGAPIVITRRARQPLSELVAGNLRKRELPPDVDREELVKLAEHYLNLAAEKEGPTIYAEAVG